MMSPLKSSFPARAVRRAALCLLALSHAPAVAQSLPVERNLPPEAAPSPGGLTMDRPAPAATDPTPLGVSIRAIHLIGRDDAVAMRTDGEAVGIGRIDIARTDGAAIPADQLRATMLAFVGKQLSMAVIADMQAAIADVYRRAGRPFVSISVPPQEITAGVVTLRVIEFGLGRVSVQGEGGARDAALAARIRAADGEPIEAARIDEDLRWLNRFPYRQVQGVFSPGDGLGRSDLTLVLAARRPWQVYAGYSNTGTRETDRNRFFFGGGFGLPGLNDAYGSWQTTGSRNLFGKAGRLLPGDGDRADYLSHSARFVLPTLARQAIEISPNFVATRQGRDSVTSDNNFFELPLYYRSALSNLLPGLYFGDLQAGVEAKMLDRRVSFDGVGLGRSRADVFQIGVGWDATWSDGTDTTLFSVMAKLNPGGVMAGNDDAGWTAYSNGRVRHANYAYATATASRITELGGGIALSNELTVQFAGRPLPDTEQIALGGLYAVRGYDLGNGVADHGVVLRNELRLLGFPLVQDDVLQPFAFLDGGIGRDIGGDRTPRLAGTGVGVDYRVAGTVTMNMTAAVALAREGNRQPRDLDLKVRFFASY